MERVDLIVTPTTAPRLARDVAWLWQTGVAEVSVELAEGPWTGAARETVRRELLAAGRERLRRKIAGQAVWLSTRDDGWLGRVVAASDLAVTSALATPPRIRPARPRRLFAVAVILLGLNALATARAVELAAAQAEAPPAAEAPAPAVVHTPQVLRDQPRARMAPPAGSIDDPDSWCGTGRVQRR
jgi:hypothetical protein